jgi:hypothetical protein
MAKSIGVSHHALAAVPRQFPNGLAEAPMIKPAATSFA